MWSNGGLRLLGLVRLAGLAALCWVLLAVSGVGGPATSVADAQAVLPDEILTPLTLIAPTVQPTPTPMPTPAAQRAPEPTPTPGVNIGPTPIPIPSQAGTGATLAASLPSEASAERSGPAGVIDQLPESIYTWMQHYGWKIEWRHGPGPGRLAETQYGTSLIVVWYDPNRSDALWAGAIAHEIGHAVAWEHFDDAQIKQWNTMRGIASWRWVPGTPNDFAVGEGDFAEAFMSYLLGHGVRSVGGPLTPEHRVWISANTPF